MIFKQSRHNLKSPDAYAQWNTSSFLNNEITTGSLKNSTKSPFQDETQSILHNYRIVSHLGKGAGSNVLSIQEYKTGINYAMKNISKCSDHYKNNKERIINEFKLQSELNHPNIVRMFSHFEDFENVYMIMEHCEGGNLYEYLKSRGRLNEEEARDMTYEIILGLEYLHNNKIVHRDLKPGNIVLTKTNSLKICDFGLAVRLQDFDSERDTFCGTPNYIAPEVCKREPYGIKSDCWSFGCILYTLVTGRPPFETMNVHETLKIVQNLKRINIPATISPQLTDLIHKILDWDSDSRLSIWQIKSHPFYSSKHCTSSESATYHTSARSSTSVQVGKAPKFTTSHRPPSIGESDFSRLTAKSQQIIKNGTVKTSNSNLARSLDHSNKEKNDSSNISSDLISSNFRPIVLSRGSSYKPSENVSSLSQNKPTPLLLQKASNPDSQSLQSKNNSEIPNSTKYSISQNNPSHRKINQIQQQIQFQQSLQENEQNSYQLHFSSRSRNQQINQQPPLNRTLDNSYQHAQLIPHKNPSILTNNQLSRSNCISNFQEPIEKQPFQNSKTILSTFLTRASKTSSLHLPQSASSTPSQMPNELGLETQYQVQPEQQISINGQKSQQPVSSSLSLVSSARITQQGTGYSQQQFYLSQKQTKTCQISQNKNLLPNGHSKNRSFDLQYSSKTPKKVINMITCTNQTPTALTIVPSSAQSYQSQSFQFPQNCLHSQENKNRNISLNKETVIKTKNFLEIMKSTIEVDISNLVTPDAEKYKAFRQSRSPHLRNEGGAFTQTPSQEFAKLATISPQNFSQTSTATPSRSSISVRANSHTPAESHRNRSVNSNNNKRVVPCSPRFLCIEQSPKGQNKTEPNESLSNRTPRLECDNTFQDFQESSTPTPYSKNSHSITTNTINTKSFNISKQISTSQIDSTVQNDNSEILQPLQDPLLPSTISTKNIEKQVPSSQLIYPPQSINSQNTISPIKINLKLEPTKIKTNNVVIEITKDRSLLVNFGNGKCIFQISQDGQQIQINKQIDNNTSQKQYNLEKLPSKYNAYYQYAKQVLSALKPKTVLSKLQNKEGVFALLENQRLEATFKSGYFIVYRKSECLMKVRCPGDSKSSIEISSIDHKNPSNSFDSVPFASKISDIVKQLIIKTIKYFDYLFIHSSSKDLEQI